MSPRPPWYWLAVLALVAVGASSLIGLGAQSRVAGLGARFSAEQHLRLGRVERRLDDYFGDGEELAKLLSETVGHVYADRGLTRWLVRQTFRGRRNQDMYGLGAAWEPYRFEHATKYVWFYDRVPDGRMGPNDRALSKSLVETGYAGNDPRFAFPSQAWYRTGSAAAGRTAYYGPYAQAGRSFVSIVRAFYRTHTTGDVGPLAGVVSVDILSSTVGRMLADGTSPGDAVALRFANGSQIRGGAVDPKVPAPDRLAAEMPLRYGAASLTMTSDAGAVGVQSRLITGLAALLIVALWGLCISAAVAIWQRSRSLAATGALERELAVAKSVEAELRRTAFTDALTGLPNRAAFVTDAATMLRSGARCTNVVLLVDIDRFNVVNETLGLRAGDALLRMLGERLVARFGAEAQVARIGGDEYALLARAADGTVIAERVLAALRDPVVLGGQSLYVSGSIGIVAVDSSYEHAEDLLRDAEIAVYRAKHLGRGRWEIFDTAMRADVARDSELEADLRKAIERRAFVPYYQPIVSIATGEIVSFEALARWKRGDGTVQASEFIPFAESRGLAHTIDGLILRGVCSQATVIGATFPGATIAVNVSAAELGSRDLPGAIEALLAEFGVPPERLRLEITETAMMLHADDAKAALDRLKNLGVAMLLDDFGTGYSSLAYLQQLPIVGLKIDRSFVERLDRDQRAVEIVRSIVALATAFELDTTAEGVENAAQLAILKRLGVRHAQGFFFSPAVELSALPGLRSAGSAEGLA